MSEHVKVAWSVPLSEGFDLKDFAEGNRGSLTRYAGFGITEQND
jgi:hypothetical protein